jgi:hypothetical protein
MKRLQTEQTARGHRTHTQRSLVEIQPVLQAKVLVESLKVVAPQTEGHRFCGSFGAKSRDLRVKVRHPRPTSAPVPLYHHPTRPRENCLLQPKPRREAKG